MDERKPAPGAPMVVWIFNHYAIPPTMPGGTRHFALARELIARGHAVTVFASNIHYSTGEEVPVERGRGWRREEVGGVPIVWIRTPPYKGNSGGRMLNMLAYAAAVLRGGAEAQAGGPPDVVLGSSPHLFAALAAYRVARRKGAGFVLEVRDLWPQSFVDLGILRAGHPLVRVLGAIERYLYRRADRIVSVLPQAAEHIVAKGAAPGRITWIPNGVDLSLYPEETGPAAAREGPFTLVYAGAHGVVNALDTVLDAAGELRRRGLGERIRFVLVGDGPEKPRLEAEARERGLTSVQFRAPVPKHAVPQVLRSADALVVTARDTDLYRHGVSFNKLFDYLAAARPVVFAFGAASNPVRDAGAGVTVPPENPVALAEAIARLAELPPGELAAMGRRGYAYVERHYAATRLGGRLEAVLREAVDAR